MKEILTDALVLRARRDTGEITPEELGVAVEGLDARVKALLARRGHTVENRKLLKHLGKEAPGLFTFLRCEGVQATNWRAEQAIRPGVVNRKVWGGSRTDRGGRTHERLVTLLRTSAQQGCDAMAVLGELIRSTPPRPGTAADPGSSGSLTPVGDANQVPPVFSPGSLGVWRSSLIPRLANRSLASS